MSETEYTYSGGLLSETVSTEYEDDITTNTLTQYENGNVKYEEIKTTTVTETEGTTVTTDKNTYAYDAYGNNTTLTTVSKTDSEAETVTNTEYEYDSLGRAVRTTVLNETSEEYVYDPLGNVLLEKTTNENNETQYTRNLYDTYGRAVQEISSEYYSAEKDSILKGSDTYSGTDGHLYEYNEQTGNLESETNELGVKTDYTYLNDIKIKEAFENYVYDYNKDGNLKKVTIGGKLYAEYTYNTNESEQLENVTYGNGHIVSYEYNSHNQITAQKYQENAQSETVTQFSYEYSTPDEDSEDDPELVSKTDCINNQKTVYSPEGRVTVYNIGTDENGEEELSLYYSYMENEESEAEDGTKTPANSVKTYSDLALTETNGEDEESFEIKSTLDENNTATAFTCKQNKNDDGEITGSSIKQGDSSVIETSYEYDEKGNITKITSVLSGGKTNVTEYTYDDKDNIKSYKENDEKEVYYTYDSKGQLVREDCKLTTKSWLTKTYVYAYDSRGNLTSKREYDYTREEIAEDAKFTDVLRFKYENNVWLDVVTENSQQEMLYDENGNLVKLGECNVIWTNGRQLSKLVYEDEQGNLNDVVSYTYDENGIRQTRTSYDPENGKETTYYTTENGYTTSEYTITEDGSKIDEMYFIYSNGEVIGASYNGRNYYYIKNVMGDVEKIVNDEGKICGEYTYDAWGNLYDSDTGELTWGTEESDFLSINPMTYRGYYYDYKLGGYYLQSRFYIPFWCRFFNADEPTYAKECKDEDIGTNLFAYCGNNPVNNFDPTGNWGYNVHCGYNPDSRNHYKLTWIENRAYFYGTYYWAIQCGFGEKNAKILADYCIELDTYYSSATYAEALGANAAQGRFFYSIEELAEFKSWQYYHFNGNKTGKDSRVKYYEGRFSAAVTKWKSAVSSYNKKIKKIKKECTHGYSKNISKCSKCKSKVNSAKKKLKSDKKIALRRLGYGLHALQDIEAHGQIGRGADIPQHVIGPKGLIKADNINYNWKGSNYTRVEKANYLKLRLLETAKKTISYMKNFIAQAKYK